MTAAQRFLALIDLASHRARLVRVAADRVETRVQATSSAPNLFLSVPRIEVVGPEAGLSDFLLGATFDGEGGRTIFAFMGPDALRGRSQLSRTGLLLVPGTLAAVPAGCSSLRLVWIQVAGNRRVRGVLDAIESAALALDYPADPQGSERVAEGIVDRLEVLLQLSESPEILSGAFAIDRLDTPSPTLHALLGGLGPDVADPQLWVRDDVLYVGRSVESAAEYHAGTSLLARLGARDLAATANLSQHVRRRWVSMVGTTVSQVVVDESAVRERRRRIEELALSLGANSNPELILTTPIRVEIASDLEQLVSFEGALRSDVLELIESIRDESRYTVGIRFPGVRFRTAPGLAPGSYTIEINEGKVEDGRAFANYQWCRQSADVLSAYGLVGISTMDPRTGTETCWLSSEDANKAKNAGFRVSDAINYLVDHLAITLWNHAHLLTTLDTVAELLSPAPALLTAVRAAEGGLARFTGVISALLEERVPVREWRVIATRHLELTASGMPAGDIVEEVRMLPTVRPSLPGNTADAAMYRLSPEIADLVSSGIVRNGMGAALIIEPEAWAVAVNRIRDVLRGAGLVRPPVVVVEEPVVRPFVRLFLNTEFPNLHVLSRRELVAPSRFETADSLP